MNNIFNTKAPVGRLGFFAYGLVVTAMSKLIEKGGDSLYDALGFAAVLLAFIPLAIYCVAVLRRVRDLEDRKRERATNGITERSRAWMGPTMIALVTLATILAGVTEVVGDSSIMAGLAIFMLLLYFPLHFYLLFAPGALADAEKAEAQARAA